MDRATKPLQPFTDHTPVASIVTLAFWRWRQHWFLLLMTGIGMAAAVLILCAVPLLTAIMQTASLRNSLRVAPTGSEIALTATVSGLSTQGVEQVYQVVNQPVSQRLGAYLNGPPRLDLETPLFNILAPTPPESSDRMAIYGTSMRAAISHVTLVQGRLPQATSTGVEVAITSETALLLHLRVGTTITLSWTLYAQSDSPPPLYHQFSMRVVGIFEVKPDDAFWHGDTFLPSEPGASGSSTEYTVLADEHNLLAALDRAASSTHAVQAFFVEPSFLTWYYYLDPSRISIHQFNDLISQLAATQSYFSANFSDAARAAYPPYIRSAGLSSALLSVSGVPSILEQLRDELAVAQLPLTLLAVLIFCLILFFMSTMATLLIDRQVDAITLLHSRGASRWQVFGAFLTQSVGLSLVALVVGPPLALASVSFIARLMLPLADQDATNVITNAPVQALWSVEGYAALAGVVAVIAMLFSLSRASRLHFQAAASDAATRSIHRPLWQRFNLDLVAMVIALTAYGLSVYLASIEQLLDAQTQALVVSPLALLAPVFLLLAALLLFLRLFPFSLHLATRFVMHARGAVPLLAVAQMARSPRRALHLILLLSLTIAFAIFTLVFTASQAQWAQDIASYQVGADFSGALPDDVLPFPLPEEIARYRHIPGVIAATAGYVEDETVAVNATTSLVLQAVDPATFAQATIWMPDNTSQPIGSLLAQLATRRAAAIQSGIIPAIVDSSTWNTLALHVGATFSLYPANASGDTLHYLAMAEVPHLPGINRSAEGGLVVDYQSFAAVQMEQNLLPTSVNHIWLHTRSDPASLASVRAALSTSALHLDQLSDRQSFADGLRHDPLSLNLVGVLALGATTAFLLALVGSLLISWLSVRRRLTNFSALRALGATPKQLAAVLLWEQGIIYATALVLGILLGALLVVTAVPRLVFSALPLSAGIGGDANINALYTLQQLIPPQIVVPASLGIAFIVLILICAIALSIMVRTVVQPSMSQVLRLDEAQSSEFLEREDAVIARSRARQTGSPRGRHSVRLSVVSLASFQLRQVWSLLLIQAIGLIAAVTLVCAVPLFSTIARTAELHHALTATPATSEITLDAFTQGLSTHVFEQVQQQINPLFQHDLGAYMSQPAMLSIQAAGFRLLSPAPANSQDEIQLIGTAMAQAAPNLHLVQGRLPQNTANGDIETLLTPVTAQSLHVTVGSVITLRGDFFTNPREMFGGPAPSGNVRVRVVGLFTLTSTQASFWHGETFQPTSTQQAHSYTFLVPNEAFLTTLDELAAAAQAETVFSPETFELLWRYRLDPSRIPVDQVDPLINNLTHLQTSIANEFGNVQADETQPDGTISFPYLMQVQVFNPTVGSYDITTILDLYRNYTADVAIPLIILALQIFGLLLFFVSLLAHLLVERQAETIALVRSRGASRSQIFGSLLIQGIGLGAIALVVGPLLAVIAASSIAEHLLGGTVQHAAALVTGHPLQAAAAVGGYAVGSVVVVILVMLFLLWRATSTNMVTTRREAARPLRRPLWRRLNLDVVAALIALTGYGISVYLASIGNLLDARTKALVSAPLTLVAPIFLLIGALIMFLRFFPSLLRLGERLAARRREAIPMLAVAQMARSPRQAGRMALLLALTIAFATFTLVFAASQAQHVSDVAAYEVGADFSGDLPASTQPLSVENETATYDHLSGVTSATVGYTSEGVSSVVSPALPMQILAVDANTFAQTAIWTRQDASQPLASLMDQLVARRQEAARDDIVPAIVDAATMHRLDLQVGNYLTITVNTLRYTSLDCVVIAQVAHIPTVNDGNETTSGGGSSLSGGVLLDYTTYATVYKQDVITSGTGGDLSLPINHVWIRTKGDPASLAQVRAALMTPGLRLDNLYDRAMLIEKMRADPLYLSLLTILALGATTALLLTLGGDLLTSWLNVRARLTSFAVLRSLGATPKQITGVLLWEQGIIYAAALLLGVIFGSVLSATAVPALTLSSTPTGGLLSGTSIDEFYAIQQALPTQIVLPFSLGLAFILLAAVCVLTLGIMSVVALHPSMSQTLRLNED